MKEPHEIPCKNHDFNALATKLLEKICFGEDIYTSPNLNFLNLSEIENLLQQGANPNIINPFLQQGSLLENAVNQSALLFIKLLFKYDVTVNSLCYDSKAIYKKRKTILQNAIDTHLTKNNAESLEIVKLIETKFPIPKEYEINHLAIKTLYQNLYSKIYAELSEATIKNKKLLIILGEKHDSFLSLLIETMIIIIIKDLNIDLILEEMNYKVFENTSKGIKSLNRLIRWETFDSRYFYAQSLGFQISPVDLGRNGARKIGPNFDDYETIDDSLPRIDSKSALGLIFRDDAMHAVIETGINKHALLIVGANHLFGLGYRLVFSNHHVLQINGTDVVVPNDIQEYGNKIFNKLCSSFSNTEDMNYIANAKCYLVSKHVFQAIHEKCFKNMKHFLYPEKIIALAQQAHLEHSLKEKTSHQESLAINGLFGVKGDPDIEPKSELSFISQIELK